MGWVGFYNSQSSSIDALASRRCHLRTNRKLNSRPPRRQTHEQRAPIIHDEGFNTVHLDPTIGAEITARRRKEPETDAIWSEFCPGRAQTFYIRKAKGGECNISASHDAAAENHAQI